MSGNTTFTMIKPDAFEAGFTGMIIQKIIENGFKIKALRLTHLQKENAEAFYAIHKDRPFFNGLVDFMISGPLVAAILEKENAVEDFRNLIGSTNPADAAEGTIRKQFAKSVQYNAVHGSDSDENAQIEANFFFSQLDRH
jgi:nucleoside-diphosphate kinase